MQFITKKEILLHGISNGKIDSQYEITETLITVIPFRDTGTSNFRRVAAHITRLEDIGGKKAHTVVVAFDGDSYYHWCGDSFLAGKYTAAERNNALKVAKDTAEETAMRELYGKYKDTGCGFWKHGGERCKHTDHAHSEISENVLDQLEDLLNGSGTGKRKRRSPKEFIEKRLYKKHVKLEGPKGSGKTYLARMVAKAHADLVINIAGSEKTDSAELEGHLVPYAERVSVTQTNLFDGGEQVVQSLTFKYGKLARAFRAAAVGKKVIVVIDEMYRIPPEQMQLLVSALSPTDGHYLLPISNMVESDHEWEDGLVEEELRAPVENLMVLATTNVGANYLVDGIDEALQDRFHTIEVPEDRELIESVVADTLKKRGFPPHLKESLMGFYDKMKRLVDDKRLTREINLRHMVEIIDTAVDNDDIPETAYEMHTQWASSTVDGARDPNEVRMIEKVIDSTLA